MAKAKKTTAKTVKTTPVETVEETKDYKFLDTKKNVSENTSEIEFTANKEELLDEELATVNEETSGDNEEVSTIETVEEVKGEREYVKDWRELVAVEGVNQTSKGKLYYGVKRK